MREVDDAGRRLGFPCSGKALGALAKEPDRRTAEIEALRTGVELGMTLDRHRRDVRRTARPKTSSAKPLAGIRDEVFLASKAYPQNAGRGRLERACEASLKRLRTDRLDLYLLHWRGSVPLAETVEGMEALHQAGKIGAWGVSNLDLADMDELAQAGGEGCATNQILYNVSRRGPEFDLLPALAERGISVVAYSPVEQGRLPTSGALRVVAERHDATPYQVALAWVMRAPGVFAIPKASDVAHVRENRAAADLQLTPEDLAAIDAEFPPPSRKTRLEML